MSHNVVVSDKLGDGTTRFHGDLADLHSRRSLVDVPRMPGADAAVCLHDYMLRNRKADLSLTLAASRDMRKWRSLEALRIQSRKIKAMQKYAQCMAHDFNNNLTTIICYIELILTDPILPASLTEKLRIVRAEARRAAESGRQFSTFSRMRTGQLQLLDFGAFIAALDEKLNSLTGSAVSLSIHVDPAAGVVMADPASLEQVVMELAGITRKGMQSGDELRIETRRLRAGTPWFRAHPEAGMVDHAMLIFQSIGRNTDVAAPSPSPEAGPVVAELQGLLDQLGAYIEAESSAICGTSYRLLLPSFSTTVSVRPTRPLEGAIGASE